MEGLVASFWVGKRVFITGHTGFKGSWLAFWLQQLGAEVSGYALDPPSTPNLYECAQVGNGMEATRGDIRDLAALQKVMLSFKPDLVFHLAAQSLVRLSYQGPLATLETNVMGTANLLECLRNCPSVRAAVIVTSDKCYKNKQWDWPYREVDSLGGHDPYSASKACAELVTSSYQSSFFSSSTSPAVATVRAGNVIGGGDWALDRLVPDIIRAFSAGNTVRIRHPQALRPWQHVLEPLRGYLLLAQGLFEKGHAFAGAWNFGPGHDAVQPVEWVVHWLAQAWGSGATWVIDETRQVHEAATLKLDSSKAAARLGWRSRLDLSTALTLTLDWYRLSLQRDDMRETCIQQIGSYRTISSDV